MFYKRTRSGRTKATLSKHIGAARAVQIAVSECSPPDCSILLPTAQLHFISFMFAYYFPCLLLQITLLPKRL